MTKRQKKDVGYRLADHAGRNCHLCRHIQLHGDDPATCALVAGTVDRDHVCNLFKAK